MALSYDSFSQCGAKPTSGSTTISASNTIVHAYYPGTTGGAAGTYTVTVGAADGRSTAAGISNGDMVVIMQMQGADITTTNNSRYGDNVNGGDASGYLTTNLVAGYYEYNVVSNYNSGTGQI